MILDHNSQGNILLMTATITPPVGVPNLQRTNPILRMEDYRQALIFYMSFIGRGISGIVFVDNSESDLAILADTACAAGQADNVEFLSFDGLKYPPAYDRGYGELIIVDHAMATARMIQALPSDGFVWKVTGRYIVRNLKRIIDKSPLRADIYCNFRNIPVRLVDMYLMRWNVLGYQHALRGAYQKLAINVPGVAPGVVPEQLLRKHLDQIAPALKLKVRFNCTPELVGIRGGDNRGYSTDNRWKFVVRKTAQIAVPSIWI
ncbi:hypothetical protein FV228_08175 [Methylobacterium sp. WL18]|uniref:hypothetical protein n=1 Tax=Methylobacterium sp. WL18 TaxID=2603897 RepID=UPI0011CA4647|nr:hypothetical protein [Methylobacterium sp. WL18]TXN73480.1 hypothetical protein FV228_08175 [Methylobacterium sp. WL18]